MSKVKCQGEEGKGNHHAIEHTTHGMIVPAGKSPSGKAPSIIASSKSIAGLGKNGDDHGHKGANPFQEHPSSVPLITHSSNEPSWFPHTPEIL